MRISRRPFWTLSFRIYFIFAPNNIACSRTFLSHFTASVAKVMFSQAPVILSLNRGGRWHQMHHGIGHGGSGQPPPPDNTLSQRTTPPPPPPPADNTCPSPLDRTTTTTTLLGNQRTSRCRQWAGGTHPTGMHSCWNMSFYDTFEYLSVIFLSEEVTITLS